MPANNTAAVRAGRAFIELFVEDGQLEVGLRSAQRRMRQFAGTVRTMGASMLSGGILANFGLGVASKVFADFEDQMSIVRGIVADTETDFMGLREEVTRLGRETSFTARQVASAAVELTRGGLSGAQTKAALANTLALARGGNVELAEAARTIVTSLSQFNLRADQAGIAADVLAKAANASASDVTDLAEALKFAGVTGALIGEDIYSVAAGLALLANAGVRGTLAGTQLGRAYKELAVGLKQQKIWDELGVKVTDFQGNMRATAEVLADIRDAMDARKWSQGRRLSFLDEVFGRGINAAAILGASRAEFEKMKKTLQESQGYASRLAATMDDNLGGSFRLLMSAVEGVAIAIGESLNGVMRDFAKSITSVGVFISEWIGRNKELVVSIGKAIAVMIPLGASMLAFAAAMRLVSFVMGSLFTTIQFVAPAFLGLATALAAVTTASLAVASIAAPAILSFLGGVATLSFNASQAVLSLGGALAGLAAGVARTAVAAIGNVVAQLISTVIGGSQAAAAAAQSAVPAAAAAASTAARQTQAAAAAAGQAASKLPRVMDIVRASALSLASGLRIVEQAIATTFAAISRGGIAAIRALLSGMGTAVTTALNFGRAMATASVDTVRFGSDVAAAAANAAGSAARWGNVTAAARTIPQAFSAAASAARAASSAISGSIVRFFTVGGPFDAAINAALNSLGKLIVAMARTVPAAFSAAVAEVRHVVNFYANAIPAAMRAANTALASFETAVLSLSARGLRPAVAAVSAFASTMITKFASAARTAASSLRLVVSTLVDGFSTAGSLFANFARVAARQLVAMQGVIVSTLVNSPRLLATAFVTLEAVILRGLIATLRAVPVAVVAAGNAISALARVASSGLVSAFSVARQGVAAFAGVVSTAMASAAAVVSKAFATATSVVVGFGQVLVSLAAGAISATVAAAQGLAAAMSVAAAGMAAAASAAASLASVLFSSVLAALATVTVAVGAVSVAIWGVQGAINKLKAAFGVLGQWASQAFSMMGSAAVKGADMVIKAMGAVFDYMGETMDRAARLKDASYMPEFERDRRLIQYLEDLDRAGQLTASQAAAARATIASLEMAYGDLRASVVEVIDAEGNIFYELYTGAEAFADALNAIDASQLQAVERRLGTVRDEIRSLNEQLAQTPYGDADANAALADRIDAARAQEEKLTALLEEIKRRQAEAGTLNPNDPIAVERENNLDQNRRSRAILDDMENERLNMMERMRGAVEDAPVTLDRSRLDERVQRELDGVVDVEAERARIEREADSELKRQRERTLKAIAQQEKRAAEEIAALRGQGVADAEIIAREQELQDELNDIRTDTLEEFNQRRLDIERQAANEIAGLYREMEQKRKEMEDEIAEQQKVLSNTAGTFSGRLIAQIGGSDVNKSILNEAKNTNRILSRIENRMGAGGFMVGAN